MCQCEGNLVQSLETEFKNILGAPADLETWAQWLQSVVNKALSNSEADDGCGPTFTKAARQFLLNWSFYRLVTLLQAKFAWLSTTTVAFIHSSMIIRDLTLRSAASFGSFHLIRLLFDEYMFYLVEQKTASVLQQSPVAVMGLHGFKSSIVAYCKSLKKTNQVTN